MRCTTVKYNGAILNLKADILAALKAATEPMDRTAIAQLCLSGTDKQVADQLYLLKKDGAIIGDKQRGGSFLYRMPTAVERKAAQETPWVAPKDVMSSAVLSARSEEEVDEIEMESIEAESLHRSLIEDHFPDAGKMIAVEVPSDDVLEEPAENGKRYIDVWPGPTLAERMSAANEMKSQPENEVSETVEEAYVKPTNYTVKGHISTPREYEEAMKRNEEEAMAEPISDEVSRFRVGVYSDGTMVLERPDEDLYGIDKTEFAVMVEFARTVGWLE